MTTSNPDISVEKVSLRDAWRSSRRLLDLVPNGRRHLKWSFVGQIANGIAASVLPLMFGPAAMAVRGADSLWWLAAPIVASSLEGLTSIRSTKHLLGISESMRLEELLAVINGTLKNADDRDARAATELRSDAVVAVSKQLDDVRSLLVDTWRWAAAQVIRVVVGTGLVAVLAVAGVSTFGPLMPMEVVASSLLTAVGLSTVSNRISLRYNREVDRANQALAKEFTKVTVESDPLFYRSIGGLRALHRIRERLEEMSQQLFKASTKDRKYAMYSSNILGRIPIMAVALLPPLVYFADPSLATTIDLTPSIAMGLTMGPAALSAANLVNESLQVITTSVVRVARLMGRLAIEAKDGHRELTRQQLDEAGVLRLVGMSRMRSAEHPEALLFDNISGEIPLVPGVVVLTGPSGIGKSTLLRMIAGLTLPDGGALQLGDFEVSQFTAISWSELFRLVPQTQRLPADKTIESILAVDPSLENLTPTQRRTHMVEAMERIGLGDVPLTRTWGSSSGGQQLRFVQAAVMLGDGRVIALDEPTNHLDKKTMGLLLGIIEEAIADGKTIVVSSHEEWFVNQLMGRGMVRSVVELAGEDDMPTTVQIRTIDRLQATGLDRYQPLYANVADPVENAQLLSKIQAEAARSVGCTWVPAAEMDALSSDQLWRQRVLRSLVILRSKAARECLQGYSTRSGLRITSGLLNNEPLLVRALAEVFSDDRVGLITYDARQKEGIRISRASSLHIFLTELGKWALDREKDGLMIGPDEVQGGLDLGTNQLIEAGRGALLAMHRAEYCQSSLSTESTDLAVAPVLQLRPA